VIATLVASGGAVPALLQVDALQRLLTTANPNATQRITKPVTAGDNVINVDNALPFPGGSFVYLTSGPTGLGGSNTAGPYQVLSSGTLAFTIVGQMNIPFVPGDLVVSVPAYAHVGDTPIDRPVDQSAFSHPAFGAQGLLALGGLPNLQTRLGYLKATLVSTTAAAQRVQVRVFDGTSAGTQIFDDYLATQAAIGSIDRLQLPRLPIVASLGNQMTIDTVGNAAGGAVSLSAGVWTEPKLR
jgi:hypothetical protein